jgi:hypothetical protein
MMVVLSAANVATASCLQVRGGIAEQQKAAVVLIPEPEKAIETPVEVSAAPSDVPLDRDASPPLRDQRNTSAAEKGGLTEAGPLRPGETPANTPRQSSFVPPSKREQQPEPHPVTSSPAADPSSAVESQPAVDEAGESQSASDIQDPEIDQLSEVP